MLHLGLPLDRLQMHDKLAILALSNTPKALFCTPGSW
jgi:hypothetical protein